MSLRLGHSCDQKGASANEDRDCGFMHKVTTQGRSWQSDQVPSVSSLRCRGCRAVHHCTGRQAAKVGRRGRLNRPAHGRAGAAVQSNPAGKETTRPPTNNKLVLACQHLWSLTLRLRVRYQADQESNRPNVVKCWTWSEQQGKFPSQSFTCKFV